MAARLLPVLLACWGALLQAQAGLLVPTSSGRPDAGVLSLREMTVDVEALCVRFRCRGGYPRRIVTTVELDAGKATGFRPLHSGDGLLR